MKKIKVEGRYNDTMRIDGLECRKNASYDTNYRGTIPRRQRKYSYLYKNSLIGFSWFNDITGINLSLMIDSFRIDEQCTEQYISLKSNLIFELFNDDEIILYNIDKRFSRKITRSEYDESERNRRLAINKLKSDYNKQRNDDAEWIKSLG